MARVSSEVVRHAHDSMLRCLWKVRGLLCSDRDTDAREWHVLRLAVIHTGDAPVLDGIGMTNDRHPQSPRAILTPDLVADQC